jgi:hypothetical protein
MPFILKEILLIGLVLALPLMFALGVWRCWNSLCTTAKPARDVPALLLAALLSPVMFGLIWWNTPTTGDKWNVWILALPSILIFGMLSYSLHTAVRRRYPLLSGLAVLISGLSAILASALAIGVVLFEAGV